jgi:hypothetical protein
VHTVEVRATDPAGNTDPDAASRTFTVDTHAPDTTITKGPKKRLRTKKKRASVRFDLQSSEASTLQCRLDGGPWEPCTSPTKHKVKRGKHVFEARATDTAGNEDPTPAEHPFRVRRKR